ncbi:uncharacterized protein [Littorina saxatilis]|uniref:Uncharacterized protein n=1 Tax=Littorina saxatilis TaxID=31220 RepID=A0AAN9BBG8_9CAEN
MATGCSVLGWTLLVLCACLFCQEVTSQTQPQVLPPGNGSDVTYASNVDTTVAPSLATPEGNSTAGTPSTTRATPDCTLASVYRVRDTLEGFLISGAKLIEIDLTLQDYPPDFLNHRLKGLFAPRHWVRSTGRQGRSLLVLEDNYDFMSLFFLSIGVHEMNVTLRDSPRGCLKDLNKEETLNAIRDILLNDFKPPGQEDGSLSVDEHVCNMKVKDNDGYAEFIYTCCHKSPDGYVICEDVMEDDWLNVLLTFIIITKVLVVLYSPSFLPGSIYRLKYVATEYICHIPDNKPVKRVKVVVTQYPSNYGSEEKVVKLSELKGMEYFKTMVDTNMHMDKVYQVTFDKVRLSVKTRRLLGENYVPVGLLKVIYNNLVRCRIRKLDSVHMCCDTDILGKLNPGVKVMKWSTCVKVLARVILLLIIISPWIIRMWVFYNFEGDMVDAKKAAAKEMGLGTYFQGSMTLFLTPLHGIFIIIYLIFIVDSAVYGIISKAMKEKFKKVLRKCLRDMRERSRIAVCSWSTRLFVVPFQMFGLVGLLLFLPYLVIVLPLAIPVAVFYLFPAVNLTIRLLIHFFLFMCPTSTVDKWENFTSKFSTLRTQLGLQRVTAEETFERGNKMSKKEVILQVVVILMCLVSFWSITFLLMEVVSFFVEMAVYTLMGIIVNAGATLQYVTVFFLTVMYGRTAFKDVHTTYLTYHKKIHTLLLEMKREEINKVARKEALDQENTVFRIQGDMVAASPEPDIRFVVKGGKPMWKTSSMLMFLDRQDTPFTPEKFFYDVINLNYCGAPGPLYVHFIGAFWTFGRILLFLFFVFVVVMSFGDAYSVSTTNQLLATVAGGFIPFLFRYVFASAGGVPSLYTDSVQFTVQFHQAINRFMQNWPIFDIVPIEFGEYNPRDSLLLNSTSVVGQQPPPSTNHSSPGFGDASGVEEGDVEKIDIDSVDGFEDEGSVDMIIDVSTAETRRGGPGGLKEAGSTSMLGDSFNRSTTSSSARMYRPPRKSERAFDV